MLTVPAGFRTISPLIKFDLSPGKGIVAIVEVDIEDDVAEWIERDNHCSFSAGNDKLH